MRALTIAVIVMGVLIVAGTMTLIVGMARRSSTPSAVNFSAVLKEPAGTRIAGIATLRDRLVVQLQGGGVDRMVLIDPATGAVEGRLSLAQPD